MKRNYVDPDMDKANIEKADKVNRDVFVFLMWLVALSSLTFILVLIREIWGK